MTFYGKYEEKNQKKYYTSFSIGLFILHRSLINYFFSREFFFNSQKLSEIIFYLNNV